MKKQLNSAREIALHVLIRVEQENAYSNLLLNSLLQEHKLSTSDRGLVTEIVYGTITWKNRLDYAIGNYVKGPLQKLEKWVLVLLRMSFYQLMFLERIPDYAVVNEAVVLAKKRGHKGIASVVNGVLRSFLRDPLKAELSSDLNPIERISILHSHPKWLVERWVKAFGIEQAEQICIANNEPPKVSARINRMKTSVDKVIDELRLENVEAIPSTIYPLGIVLQSSGNPIETDSFKKGHYTIQDESSMLVGHLLDPKPHMTVLDACAAPGGKSTHIAELMDNKGSILANDLHPHKEKLIQQQVERLSISIIRTSVADAADLHKRNIGQFDRILIDAPCTGFGVIRKKPDLKWNKHIDDIKAISYIQYQLLSNLSTLLKRDGKLIYSTCTIEVEENQNLIYRFLKDHPQFMLDTTLVDDLPNDELKSKVEVPGMLQILPHYWGTDGFFIARLIYA